MSMKMKKTNFDVYKNELDMITEAGYMVAVKNGKPVKCLDIDCSECELERGPSESYCTPALIQWMVHPYGEHILTESEKNLCRYLKTGFIVRNDTGYLYWYKEKPIKMSCCWVPSNDKKPGINITLILALDDFKFITWEDEEPWGVKVND